MNANRIRSALLMLALIATFPAAAFAQPVEEKDLLKGKVTIAEDRGYIFVHGKARQIGWFVRQPVQEDYDKFQAQWEEAYAEEVERYDKAVKRYENDVEFAKQVRRDPPEPPVKPERETFSIGAIESRMGVGFGPQFVYSKGEDYFSYLVSVQPGTYTYYGPITFNPETGYVGVCQCMGSVKFEVKAGAITNLGDFLNLDWATAAELKQSSVFNTEVRPGAGGGLGAIFAPPWASEPKVQQSAASTLDGRAAVPANYDLPESLAPYPNQRADLRAAGKMNNFLGIRIGRFPPVPGVLAYERDKVIDLVAKAEMEAAAAKAAAAKAAAEEAERVERERLGAEQAAATAVAQVSAPTTE
jgi:hypothetical protein